MRGVVKTIESMMVDIEQVDRSLTFQELPERVILLVGETKAGKTTLMYYLLGKKLERWYNTEIGVHMMRPQSQFFSAYIGNNYDSTTVYPNIPTELGEDHVLVIDLPGFSDTRYQYKLFNIYIVREVIKKIRNVHISLVVSNQTRDANDLMAILERYIALLNPELLLTQNSLSLMLTKADSKDDIEVLEESLGAIAEEKDESVDIMRTLIASNKYFFLNDQPVVEEGVRLRNKMVKENNFFEINRQVDNLLSKQYANVIAGEGDEEFQKFTIKLIDGIEVNLANLYNIYTLCMIQHHERDFSILEIYVQGEKAIRKQQIRNLALEIELSNLGDLQIFEDGPEQALSTSVLNLLKKYQKIPPKDGQIQLFNGQLANLQQWTCLFKSQVSRISSIFRETLHRLIRACIKILNTISHINFSKIKDRYDAIRQSAKITLAIRKYYAFYDENDLLNRIAFHQIGKQLRSESEELKMMLVAKLPDLGKDEEEGDVVVEKVKIPVRQEIKNKKILRALQETTKGQPRPKKIQKVTSININTLDDQAMKIINSMPIQATSLRILLEAISKHKSKLNQVTDSKVIRAGKTMFTKIAQILNILCHPEQAILFLLAASCELSASRYIRQAINFRLISTQYIKSILIPYYSMINPKFQLIEVFFNYLSILTYNMQGIIANQKNYADILDKMHHLNYDEMEELRMFEFKYVESLLIEREGLYEAVRVKEQGLKSARINLMQKEIAEISNI